MAVHDEAGAALKRQGEKDRKEAALQKEIRRKVVQNLYATYEGRALLWWLLQVGKAIGVNPFRGDPNATAFICGEMNIGQQIMAFLIECNPTAFADLMKEKENEYHARRKLNDASGPAAEPGLFDASGSDDDSASEPADAAPALYK